MKRHRKLILPGFQLRLVGSFLAMSILAMALQFLLLGYLLRRAALAADGGSGQLVDSIPLILLQVGGLSLAVLLPVLLAFGIVRTFRIAGPIYRFQAYLASVAKGEEKGPCTLREGDELQELCGYINEAVGSLRRSDAARAEGTRAA